MTCPIYLDVNVPRAVLLGLRQNGLDAITAQEDGTAEATDEDLLRRSRELNRLLLTQDHDFIGIASRLTRIGESFPTILFMTPAISTRVAIEDVTLFATCATIEEQNSHLIFLPLRSHSTDE